MSWFCRGKNIIAEADKSNESDLQNLTLISDVVSCGEQSPIKATLTNSLTDRYVC